MTKGILTVRLVSLWLGAMGYANWVSASEIVWTTPSYTFLPFLSDTNYRTLSLDYGTQATMVGDALRINGPGVYDLSSDPDLSRFLELANDGISEDVTWRVDGVYYKTEPEWLGYATGELPDLSSFHVTEMQLDVFTYDEHQAMTVRWEFLTVPEPVTSLVALTSCSFFALSQFRSRRRPE
jgi:hypothetical protein